MLTPRELFFRSRDLEFGAEGKINAGGKEVDFVVRIAMDFESGTRYLKFLINESEYTADICRHILSDLQQYLVLDDGVSIRTGLNNFGEESDSSDLNFSGRVIFWTYSKISEMERLKISKLANALNLRVLIRDKSYTDARNKNETPLAFISHDSKDKEIFVRGLAASISQSGFSVWYDEYSLAPGDSLRKNIEDGLKTCPKCIVVLSKNFLCNDGWAAREFDSIYTRELLEKRNIIVPVWLDVSNNDVFDYSPILADRVAVIVDPDDIDASVRKIIVAISTP